MSKKMYEVAIIVGNTITRGGIKVTKETATKWANANNKLDPDNEYIVIEADENAITWREYLAECKAYAEG